MSSILEKLGLAPKQEPAVTAERKHKIARDKDGKAKYSKVAYVYGQIFVAYIENDMQDKFTLVNKDVRTWKQILFYLVRNGIIKNFKLGDTIETACELTITGFDGENLMYENYLKGIIKNLQKEETKEAV